MKKHFSIFFVVFFLVSCGSGSSASNPNSTPATGTVSGTGTFDADISDALSPTDLPIVTQKDDATFTVSCAEGMTTAYGLAEISCSNQTYYAACSCGEVVFAYYTNGSASNMQCSSVDLACDASGFPIQGSYGSTCSATSVSIKNYMQGTAGECSVSADTILVPADTSQSTNELGVIDENSSNGILNGITTHYNAYSFDAEDNQVLTVSFGHNWTTSDLFLAVYSADFFNPNQLEENILAQDTEGYTDSLSLTLPGAGSYIIVVGDYQSLDVDYSLDWTLSTEEVSEPYVDADGIFEMTGTISGNSALRYIDAKDSQGEDVVLNLDYTYEARMFTAESGQTINFSMTTSLDALVSYPDAGDYDYGVDYGVVLAVYRAGEFSPGDIDLNVFGLLDGITAGPVTLSVPVVETGIYVVIAAGPSEEDISYTLTWVIN